MGVAFVEPLRLVLIEFLEDPAKHMDKWMAQAPRAASAALVDTPAPLHKVRRV